MLRYAIPLVIAAVAAGSAVARDATAPNVAATRVTTEYQGNDAQRMACTGDVFRLCAQNIPDIAAIRVCLQEQKPQLSPDCRAVFESRFR
jgi:hypothetical protein